MTVAESVSRYARGEAECSMFLQMLGLVETPKGQRCDNCGGRLRADNKYGACTKNPRCRRLHQRRQFRVLSGWEPDRARSTPARAYGSRIYNN